MALLKTISGIRGTLGGQPGNNLTARDIVDSTAAYATWLKENKHPLKVVIGRDARISGKIVNSLVCSTLQAMGVSVIDLGLSTTPTVEIAVPLEEAGGGIILTASHNPKEWNALKLLNSKGEFLSQKDGARIIELSDSSDIEYASVDNLGTYVKKDGYIQKHVEQILDLPLVNAEAIKAKNYTVVVDCVNSTGAISMPALLEQLGCKVILLNEEMTGKFAHNPEPLPENLRDLSEAVVKNRAQLGIAVDPDVDRLALICEDGEMFGEEYTLVAVADYILKHNPGPTVSNLSSTRALRDVSQKYGQTYTASKVGEVNVVEKMKETQAVIGGEGNGGIIYPELHYGRDALVGVALLLSHLTELDTRLSHLKQTYPSYTIVKNKIQLSPDIDLEYLFEELKKKYAREEQITIDGLKIDFEDGWIHLRKSNTEPIIRIYTEANSSVIADNFANKIKADINEILKTSPNKV